LLRCKGQPRPRYRSPHVVQGFEPIDVGTVAVRLARRTISTSFTGSAPGLPPCASSSSLQGDHGRVAFGNVRIRPYRQP
jgi:hypothetical protein